MKICKSALKDYFDEKDALDEYVIAKLTRQVYKLEQLPGGSKIRTVQKKCVAQILITNTVSNAAL